MTRKFALAALAVAALAAGPIFTTQAEAKNGQRGAGIALGIAPNTDGLWLAIPQPSAMRCAVLVAVAVSPE